MLTKDCHKNRTTKNKLGFFYYNCCHMSFAITFIDILSSNIDKKIKKKINIIKFFTTIMIVSYTYNGTS